MKKTLWRRIVGRKKINVNAADARHQKTPYSDEYFEQANSFASDMVGSLLASRDRNQKLIMLLGACVVVLSVALAVMGVTHRSKVLVIHRDDNGVVWAAWAANSQYISTTKAELRSELTRYVLTRESYHYDEFNFQYKIVGILSTDPVFKTFQQAQAASQKSSNLSVLGQDGAKTVTVNNILFIDSAENKSKPTVKGMAHQNLAQIYFTVTTHQHNMPVVTLPYRATVSWKYEGVPTNPEYQAYDWNGFTITRYDREQATTLGDNSNA